MEHVRLKDVCTLINGRAYKQEELLSNGKYPVLRVGNFFSDKDFYYSDLELDEDKYCDNGDLLFAWSASFGPKIWTGEKVIYHYHIWKMVLSDRVDKEYLYYYLLYLSERIKAEGHGGIMIHTTKAEMEEREILLPSLKQQKEFVCILNRMQTIIQNRKLEVQKLDDLIKARFVEMFGNQESNPFGWQQTSVGMCCTLKSGTSLPANNENEGGPIPYIKVGDMNYPGNERYITTSSKFVSEKTAGKGIFPIGSIIFPKRGGAIGTNKKRMAKLPICADLNVMGVFSNGDLLPEYLMAYFDMIDLGSLDNGSSVPQINNKDISPLKICLPPIDLQKEYSAFVKQVDKSKSVVQKSLDEAQLLFDSLMQKYFG